MTQRLLLILVSLWPSAFSALSAQVGFSLPFMNDVDPGTTITVPVRVSNFDSIVATQFVVQWDPEVLSFIKIILYNLPGMDYLDFGLTEAQDSGLIRFAWEAPSSYFNSGVTVADETAIFRIQFNVTGQINEDSPLLISEKPPTDFEVLQVGHPALTIDSCEITNGFVAVGYTVSAGEPDHNTLPVVIRPNPFSSVSTVVFDLESDEIVHFRITDTAGRLIEEKKISLPPGQHGMEIVSDQLQENGIYYLILRTATRSCIRPLVKF